MGIWKATVGSISKTFDNANDVGAWILGRIMEIPDTVFSTKVSIEATVSEKEDVFSHFLSNSFESPFPDTITAYINVTIPS